MSHLLKPRDQFLFARVGIFGRRRSSSSTSIPHPKMKHFRVRPHGGEKFRIIEITIEVSESDDQDARHQNSTGRTHVRIV